MSKLPIKQTGDFGYIALYKGKRAEIWTSKGIYQAQLIAAEYFGVKPKNSYQISVTLCERPDGTEVYANV